MQNLAKMKDILFILLVTGVFTLISNLAGGHIKTIGEPSIGVLILVAISALGALLSMLPGFKKLPMVFWVSLIAVVVSLPQFPGSDVLLSYTKQVNFLAITTPILAYGGLCLGKDLEPEFCTSLFDPHEEAFSLRNSLNYEGLSGEIDDAA